MDLWWKVMKPFWVTEYRSAAELQQCVVLVFWACCKQWIHASIRHRELYFICQLEQPKRSPSLTQSMSSNFWSCGSPLALDVCLSPELIYPLCAHSVPHHKARGTGNKLLFSFLRRAKVKTHEGQWMVYALFCSSWPQFQLESKPDLYYWDHLGTFIWGSERNSRRSQQYDFFSPSKEVI